jgi:hypothetical protein
MATLISGLNIYSGASGAKLVFNEKLGGGGDPAACCWDGTIDYLTTHGIKKPMRFLKG